MVTAVRTLRRKPPAQFPPVVAGAPVPLARPVQIPAAFQILLGAYILLTGDLTTVLQAIAFGVQGSAGAEFAAAMAISMTRDLLFLAVIVFASRHPLGILHPLLLAVVFWPLLTKVPSVIEDYGGWAGVLAGSQVQSPRFAGLPGYSGTAVWLAISKYEAIQVVNVVCIFGGFWLLKRKQAIARTPIGLSNTLVGRSVLLGLLVFSVFVLMAFVYSRGGLSAHLTSLGGGRFRQLAGDGPILVVTSLGAIAIYLWVAMRPQDVKQPMFLLSVIGVSAVQFISDGSRTSAFNVPMIAGLVWAIRMQKVPWRTALILAPLFFAAIGLLQAVRTSSWTGQTAGEALATTGWSQSLTLAEQEIQLRQVMSAQVPIIEKGFEVAGGPLLGRSYLAAFSAMVPRAIWEDKPRGPGPLYATMFLGTAKDAVGIPVSPPVEMYWNFGLIGLITLSVAYGGLIRFVYQFLWQRYPSPFAIVFYVIFITDFDVGTTSLVKLQQDMLMLLACYVAVLLFVSKVSLSRHDVGQQLAARQAAILSQPLS